MQGFWKLVSVLISLAGFTATGVILLMKGDVLADVVLKAIAVFAVLYFVQRFLGGILLSVISSGSPEPASTDTEPQSG